MSHHWWCGQRVRMVHWVLIHCCLLTSGHSTVSEQSTPVSHTTEAHTWLGSQPSPPPPPWQPRLAPAQSSSSALLSSLTRVSGRDNPEPGTHPPLSSAPTSTLIFSLDTHQ